MIRQIKLSLDDGVKAEIVGNAVILTVCDGDGKGSGICSVYSRTDSSCVWGDCGWLKVTKNGTIAVKNYY